MATLSLNLNKNSGGERRRVPYTAAEQRLMKVLMLLAIVGGGLTEQIGAKLTDKEKELADKRETDPELIPIWAAISAASAEKDGFEPVVRKAWTELIKAKFAKIGEDQVALDAANFPHQRDFVSVNLLARQALAGYKVPAPMIDGLFKKWGGKKSKTRPATPEDLAKLAGQSVDDGDDGDGDDEDGETATA